MNNDLISREALKKEVALMFGNKTHITESVCELIDNAPTVNPCDNCDLYFKAMTKEIDRWYRKEEQKGSADCMDEDAKQASVPYSYQMPKDYIKNKLDYSRPQGEWICPNCELYEQVEDDYCRYAGECTIGCHQCKYFEQKGGAE